MKTCKILQHSILKSAAVQQYITSPGIQELESSKKSYWPEEGEKVGDGRAEESSAIGDRGEAAISLRHDVDDTVSGPLLEPDA